MSFKNPTLCIIDDEEKARHAIRAALELTNSPVQVTGEAGTVKDGIKLVLETRPDIILLDIQLSDGTGFDLLEKIHTQMPQVIFITAFEQFAIQAFRFSAVDFILKPIDPLHLRQAIEKASKQLHSGSMEIQIQQLLHLLSNPVKEAKKIILKTSEHIHIVHVNEIIRVESDKNYSTFYLTGSSPVVISRTLKDFDDLLTEFGFIRVHQSHLVNLDYIIKFDKRDGGFLLLKDQSRVPVSTRKKEELLRQLEGL